LRSSNDRLLVEPFVQALLQAIPKEIDEVAVTAQAHCSRWPLGLDEFVGLFLAAST
jgi:hypothetical protein